MKKLMVIMMLLAATVAVAQEQEMRSMRGRVVFDDAGAPSFISGELGRLPAGDRANAAREFLESKKALLGAAGSERFETIRAVNDGLGQTHVRLQQRINGLPVVGAEYIVHSDANGEVLAMNGRFVADRNLPRNPEVSAWDAVERAVSQIGVERPAYNGWPRLTYVVNEKGNAFLAYVAEISYVDADGEERDFVYADATTGDLVLRAPQIHRARSRETYHGNNSSTLPGTRILTETSGSTSDSVINTAHAHAGTSYDYYYGVHGRDSFNNAGAIIKTTVHHQVNYNNAFWNGSQLVYGDGDGSSFSPLGNSLDVGAHELTHAVTTYSANLTYSNESGALNEATSDIMASAVEAWKKGVVDANTWKVGEDIYTPGTAGDALRYMNNPTQDGSSKDYYPERYVGASDNGGVHWNSGIGNLAFKLMVTGGTHPRSKTTVSVPALNATATTSMSMAAKIWYRALTVYMTSSTNFEGARSATSRAATDLYGAAAADSVNKAWDAVGAPAPAPTTALTNGVAVTGLSSSTGSWKHFKIAVPSGQSKLDVVQTGGTGDADLYVKYGAQPTSSSYDYRPYKSGNEETVSVTSPAAGDWYISIYAYSSYSSLSIKATHSSTSTGTCSSASGSLSGTGANWYSAQYSSSVSGSHTGKLTGPSGTDFDLYLQKWNGSSWAIVARGETSTSTENVSYSGTSGSYRWRVYAYSGSGSFTLCTTKP